MPIEELRPGLHRWTAPHPDWEAESEPGGPSDWAQLVGSVAIETEHCVVLVDPLVPDELWPELDELVAARPVAVVTTVRWHGRSGGAVRARYHHADVPEQVAFVDFPAADERMVWLEAHHALVPGDRLLGDDAGGLRLCPESWLRYIGTGLTPADLGRLLDPLLDLPVELVLVSHGEPVLSGGREAIRKALAG